MNPAPSQHERVATVSHSGAGLGVRPGWAQRCPPQCRSARTVPCQSRAEQGLYPRGGGGRALRAERQRPPSCCCPPQPGTRGTSAGSVVWEEQGGRGALVAHALSRRRFPPGGFPPCRLFSMSFRSCHTFKQNETH